MSNHRLLLLCCLNSDKILRGEPPTFPFYDNFQFSITDFQFPKAVGFE